MILEKWSPCIIFQSQLGRVKRIWYLSPIWAGKVQASLHICSLIQAVSQKEPSDRKPDPWPLWMAGHAQLKFVMTECSKTHSLDAAQLIFKVNTVSPCVNQTSMNIYAKALSHIFWGPRQTVKTKIRHRRRRRLIRVYTVCLQEFLFEIE